MSAGSRFRSLVRAATRRKRVARERQEEWSFHVAKRTPALIAGGLVTWFLDLQSDLKYALRQLRRSPGFAAVAIATLALGFGANTAIFSLVNGLLLRPLPVADPGRLVVIGSGTSQSSTFAIWEGVRRRSASFDGAIAWSSLRFNLATSGEMQPVSGMFVSGDFFNVLGVPAAIGRTFVPADDVRGGGMDGAVAVISDRFWQRRFARSTEAVGTSLTVQDVSFTIIGVTPPAFRGLEVGQSFDVAVPIGTEPLMLGADTMLDQRSRWWLNVMLRLKADQSAEAAQALLRAAQPQIREAAMPPDAPPQARLEFLKAPFTAASAANGVSVSGLRRQYQRPLLIVLAIGGLVLAIGCVNLANLLLARASARQQEMSVRLALGAGRARLTRQLLIESLTIAALGALAGLLVAAWGTRALVAQLSDSVSQVSLDLSLDWRTLMFTALTTMATVVLFGLAPAFRASAARPIDALRSARADGVERRGRLSSSLVVVQVALSLVLVVGSILLVRTFVILQGRADGFDRESVLIVNVNASRAHPNPAGRLLFLQQLVDAAAALPGVEAAGGSAIPPILGSALSIVVDAPRGELAEAERRTLINAVSPRWFGAFGTPVLAGRDFEPADTAESLLVVVVNEAFRRRFHPDGGALGETVTFALGGSEQRSTARRIVGVVGDAPYRSLRDEVRPTVYVPLAQWTSPFPLTGISIGVRAKNPGPAQVRRPLTAALTGINRNLAFNFRLFDEQVSASVAQERLVAVLSGAFGALALLLAALGMYGVTAYSVGRRRYEIGLRLALGAEPRGVVRLVLGRLFLLVGIGVAIGALVSRWTVQLVAPILYGFEPGDPSSFAAGTVILLVVAGIAGWVPAWRAAHIDPAETLRSS